MHSKRQASPSSILLALPQQTLPAPAEIHLPLAHRLISGSTMVGA